jgi:hypothetical protein
MYSPNLAIPSIGYEYLGTIFYYFQFHSHHSLSAAPIFLPKRYIHLLGGGEEGNCVKHFEDKFPQIESPFSL